MGIYIENAEMPKTCDECPCHYLSRGDMEYTFDEDICKALHKVLVEHRYNGREIINPDKERLPNCPLKEMERKSVGDVAAACGMQSSDILQHYLNDFQLFEAAGFSFFKEKDKKAVWE